MDDIKSILKKYWGYQDFRGSQEEIIKSVLNGDDILAIMPTGGGKSICYQVPALSSQKTTLVISPLVALMKDQVDNLLSKGIKAAAIHSGMRQQEIDIALDNAIYNPLDLLYVSPERLQNHLFQERVKKIPIGMVAVDEAHCISQWGHDFRPSYLEISKIREILPEPLPILALTASATPKVEEDILSFLGLKKPKTFKNSSKRANLSLSCYAENNKIERVIKALDNVQGSTLIYVRNRRKTKEIANELNARGFHATFYHAGLGHETKFKHQENWKSGKTRIMVCTNAFGMGIDKEDVRLVIHFDLPDSIEAYYQEVGRAGRDEKLAFGLTVFNQADIDSLDELKSVKYPDYKEIINCYNALSNFYKLALGSGESQVFDLPIERICRGFNLHPIDLIRSIGVLEKMGYLSYIISQNWASTLRFQLNPKELYKFQVENPNEEPIIKALLRIHGGELYTQYVPIQEQKISKISGIGIERIKTLLTELRKRKVLDYHASKPGSKVIYLIGRRNESSIKESYNQIIEKAKKSFAQKLDSSISFYKEEKRCRMAQIQEYFGESNAKDCGKCDNCIKKNKSKTESDEMAHAFKFVRTTLQEKKIMSLKDLTSGVSKRKESLIIEAVRSYLESGELKKNDRGQVFLNSEN